MGSRGIEKEGLPVDLVREVEKEYQRGGRSKSNIPDKAFRAVRERPLLLLHLIRVIDNDQYLDTRGVPLVALGLSFPEFDDPGEVRRVRYRVNIVEWRKRFDNEVDDDLEVDDDAI